MINGQGAYSLMKYESGVHRVQRVPETESGGRIHTSTISVAVMPEVDDDIDIVIDEKDIRIDVMRASGNGGQCVNTTDSAVQMCIRDRRTEARISSVVSPGRPKIRCVMTLSLIHI